MLPLFPSHAEPTENLVILYFIVVRSGKPQFNINIWEKKKKKVTNVYDIYCYKYEMVKT